MLNLDYLAGYSSPAFPIPETEVSSLNRFRALLFVLATIGLAALSPRLFGKGSPCDILIQSTTDVYGELAPCG